MKNLKNLQNELVSDAVSKSVTATVPATGASDYY